MVSSHYTENQLVEQPAIELFAALGWQTMSATDESFGRGGTLGRETRDDAVIATLRKQLDEATCKRVLRDTVTVTATCWVYDAIKRICGERG